MKAKGANSKPRAGHRVGERVGNWEITYKFDREPDQRHTPRLYLFKCLTCGYERKEGVYRIENTRKECSGCKRKEFDQKHAVGNVISGQEILGSTDEPVLIDRLFSVKCTVCGHKKLINYMELAKIRCTHSHRYDGLYAFASRFKMSPAGIFNIMRKFGLAREQLEKMTRKEFNQYRKGGAKNPYVVPKLKELVTRLKSSPHTIYTIAEKHRLTFEQLKTMPVEEFLSYRKNRSKRLKQIPGVSHGSK